MTRLRRVTTVMLLALAMGALLYPAADRYWRAGQLLTHLATALSSDASARQSDAAPRLVEQSVSIPGPGRSIEARIYRRADRLRGPGVVIVHGVHYRGIDERRLVVFARALASTGAVVFTPELEDLCDYRVSPEGVRTIADSVRYLAARADLVSRPRVGVIGFSFAGGLALVAAAQPGTADHLDYVVSVGGHHDLGRVMRFLITSQVQTPGGLQPLQAHEYGLVVAVYEHLDRFVTSEDLPVISQAFRAWLQEDRDRARRLASQRSTEEGERLFGLLEAGRLAELRPELEAILDAEAYNLAALSPRGKLGAIGVPVYLLHGAGDTVIPPSEAEWASRELGSNRHEILVTPLIEHVAVRGEPEWQQQVELVQFMARLL